MVHPGETILRADGDRLTFRKTPHETDGALLEVEVVYGPRSSVPPSHYHPHQEEWFRVQSGAIRAGIGAEERTYGAGDAFTVPPGTRHWMHNAGDEPARVLWQVRPALRTAEFFEAMWTLPDEKRNLFTLAAILRKYPREFRLSRPPYIVQRVLFTVLASLGGMFGSRPK